MKKIFFMFLTAVSFLGASELNIYSADIIMLILKS